MVNELVRGELHVCPICYVLLGGSREKDPLQVLLSDGGSLLDRLMNGAKVVFHSKNELVDHMETCHSVTEASSRRFTALFHRHKLRDADGLTQSFIHTEGINFNIYWDLNGYRRREIFNQLFFLSAGIRSVKECHRPDELFDANCAVIDGKDIWSDLLRDNDEIIDHDAESEDFVDGTASEGSSIEDGEVGSFGGEADSLDGEVRSPDGEFGPRPCEIQEEEIDEVLRMQERFQESAPVIEQSDVDEDDDEEDESVSEKFRREIRNIRRKKRFRIDD